MMSAAGEAAPADSNRHVYKARSTQGSGRINSLHCPAAISEFNQIVEGSIIAAVEE